MSATDAPTGSRPRSPTAGGGRAAHLPAIEGLRTVAVAAVVAYHLHRFEGGFLGVDLFFAISGFLITRSLLFEKGATGGISLRRFWWRRFRRLVPALLVVVVATAAAARWRLPAYRLADVRGDALAAIAYVANWRFIVDGQSYFTADAPSLLRHTWSLAVEEQFYVVWPLVVIAALAVTRRLTIRRGRRPTATSAVRGLAVAIGSIAVASGVAMALLVDPDAPTRTYFGTDTRALTLCAGALAACALPAVRRAGAAGRGRLRLAGGVALVGLAALSVVASADAVWFHRGGFQLAGALSAVVVLALAVAGGPVATVLRNPVLMWLGRRSYGIYLWSWPVQTLLEGEPWASGWRLDLVVVTVTVALASVSFAVVERPIMGWSPTPLRSAPRRIAPLRLTQVAGVAGLVVVGVWLPTTTDESRPEYLEVEDEEAVSAALAPPESRPPSAPTTTIPPGSTPLDPNLPLVIGDPADVVPGTGPGGGGAEPGGGGDAVPGERADGPLRMMLAGDSVGWTLGWSPSPAIDDIADVDLRALIGCGVMPPDAIRLIGGTESPYSEDCRVQADAERIGLSGGPELVLLWMGAWEVYDHVVDGEELRVGTRRFARYLEERIQDRVDTYREAGVPTIITLVPCFGENAPRLGDERRRPSRIRWVNDRIRAVAEDNPGWVRLLPVGDALCDGAEPVTTTPDGHPLRQDGSHFDSAAAGWFWREWLVPRLRIA